MIFSTVSLLRFLIKGKRQIKMPISAFLFDAYYKGASCGHCNNEALNTVEVYNMTGVQQDAGGTGRIFPN